MGTSVEEHRARCTSNATPSVITGIEQREQQQLAPRSLQDQHHGYAPFALTNHHGEQAKDLFGDSGASAVSHLLIEESKSGNRRTVYPNNFHERN